MKIGGSNMKKIFSTLLTVAGAISAVAGVITEKKQADEFEEMKKQIAELQKEKES